MGGTGVGEEGEGQAGLPGLERAAGLVLATRGGREAQRVLDVGRRQLRGSGPLMEGQGV